VTTSQDWRAGVETTDDGLQIQRKEHRYIYNTSFLRAPRYLSRMVTKNGYNLPQFVCEMHGLGVGTKRMIHEIETWSPSTPSRVQNPTRRGWSS
jgi:hypothetical protein